MPFDGFAIGGLAVGEGRDERQDVCEHTAERMPRDRPRYLMGVGTPLDLLEAVHRGVDMFDCILPTALGQRGGVFTSRGYLQLRRGVHKHADEALDPACGCPTCQQPLARLPPSPDEDRRGARLAAAGPAQPALLPPAHARDPAEHPGRHVRLPLRGEARAARGARPRQPELLRPARAPAKALGPRRVRGARGPGGIREHPPRGVGRGHARAHAADGRGPEPLRRAVRPRPATAARRRRERRRTPRRSCSGTWASGPAPTPWRPSAATSRRPPSTPCRALAS